MMRCWGANPEIVEFLVQHGADPNAPDVNGDTPLHLAAEAGSLATVRMFLDAGGNPLAENAKGQTPLDLAVAEGHDDVAELLEEWR